MALPSEALDGGDAFFGRLGKPVGQIGLRILEVGKPPFSHRLFDHDRSPAFSTFFAMDYSRNSISFLRRDGWRSLFSALVSI
jgi:hypothetical protein